MSRLREVLAENIDRAGMVKDFAHHWNPLLERLRSRFGGGIIAGGATRDLLAGFAYRDVDFWVPCDSKERLERSLVGIFDRDPTTKSSYAEPAPLIVGGLGDYADQGKSFIMGVARVKYNNIAVDVIGCDFSDGKKSRPTRWFQGRQSLISEAVLAFTPARVIDTFDFDICKSYYDGVGIIESGAAMADRYRKTWTRSYSPANSGPSLAHYQRVMGRWMNDPANPDRPHQHVWPIRGEMRLQGEKKPPTKPLSRWSMP